MLSSTKNIRTFLYHALFFVFGSIVTLSFTQLDTKKCIAELIKEENFKYYKVSKLENPSLIILIVSSPNNLDRRNVIRETWLTLHDKKNDIKLKHFFVMGSVGLSTDDMLHLSSEQSKYSDLLILPIKDKYETLSNKVLQSFVWLNEQIRYGLNFSFVLKCDDDTFIRTDLLQKDIQKFAPKYGKNATSNYVEPVLDEGVFSLSSQVNEKHKKRHLYWGYFNGNAQIKTKGKWQEDNWFLCDRYLPYALGGGYILSQGLVKYLARNSDDLKLYKSEDISVGTWLAPVANLDRLHDVRFNTEWNSRGCLNLYIIHHKISINEIRNMYENLKTKGKICLEETQRRKHYLYEWNSTPSKCCIKH